LTQCFTANRKRDAVCEALHICDMEHVGGLQYLRSQVTSLWVSGQQPTGKMSPGQTPP